MTLTEPTHPDALRARQLALARIGVIAAPVIAVLVLLGWFSGLDTLITFVPGGTAMKRNTAIALLLLGVALRLALREARAGQRAPVSTGVLALALPAGMIAVYTLYQYATQQADDGGLRATAGPGGEELPVHMAPLSALGVVLGAIAAALLATHRAACVLWAQRVASLLALAMLVVIYGHLFDAPLLYHVSTYPPTALHSALALGLLAVSVLFLTGDRGWVADLWQDTPASSAARRTLFLFLALVPVAGTLRLMGQRFGYYDTEVGLALMCVAFTAAIALLLRYTVRRANVAERTIARLSRLYAMLSHTNQAIVRSPEAHKLYQRICQLAIEHGGFAAAWVGLLDAEARLTRVVARAGDAQTCPVPWQTTEKDAWPYAAALLEDRLCFSSYGDASADEPPWFAATRRAGLHTVAIPFRRGGKVVGALNLCAVDPDYFGAYAWPTLQEVGADISFALDNQVREEARVAAVDALQASERRYEDLAAEVPVGLFQLTIGAAGPPRFLYVNPPLCALLDTEADALLNGPDFPMARVLDEDRPTLERLRDGFRHSDEPVNAELRFATRNGIRHLRLLARRTAVDGALRRWSGVVVDLTEQVQAERERDRLRAQLMQAQRMEAVGQLTGGIAHDFNNILGAVLGFSTLAMSREVDDPDSRLARYLGEVQRGAERARDLVQRMLKFSRGTVAEGDAGPIDPAAALNETLRLLASVLPASIAVDARIEADLPPIAVDAIEFQQLVMNLALNARDALEGSGRITIDLRRTRRADALCSACDERFDGEFVELGVADDGPGIEAADQREVFQPFYTTKALDQGTGLGLAVVNGIMHRAAGHILLDSTRGAGTRFALLFPLRAASQDKHDTTQPPPARGARAGARIMVVDDEVALLRLWTDLLEGAGYQVQAHHDAAAALAAFEAAPEALDAMIVDMTMPTLSGDAFARAVLGRRPELPLFVCTGYSDRLDALLARSIGVRGVFTKPLDFDDVQRRLSAALADLQ